MAAVGRAQPALDEERIAQHRDDLVADELAQGTHVGGVGGLGEGHHDLLPDELQRQRLEVPPMGCRDELDQGGCRLVGVEVDLRQAGELGQDRDHDRGRHQLAADDHRAHLRPGLRRLAQQRDEILLAGVPGGHERPDQLARPLRPGGCRERAHRATSRTRAAVWGPRAVARPEAPVPGPTSHPRRSAGPTSSQELWFCMWRIPPARGEQPDNADRVASPSRLLSDSAVRLTR